MGISDRLRLAGRALFGREPAAPAAPSRNPDDAPFVVRAARAGHLPGLWGSDHLAELRQYKNATYLAVHAACIQAAQATVSVKVRKPRVTKGHASAPDAADDGKTPAPDHPIARLLRRPNPLTDGGTFQYQIDQQIRLTGGAVIWERRNGLNLPAELWVIPRGWLTFQRPTDEYRFGFWRVNPTYAGQWMSPWVGGSAFWGQTQWELDVRKTIRIGWPDPNNPGEFTSPLDACANIIDTSNQTEKAVWSQLMRGIRPSAILSILDGAAGPAGALTPEQRDQLRAEMEEFCGADKDGKFILGNNIAFEMVTPDLAKLQGIEARKQNYEMVFNVQGTPTAATGAIGETSYAGLAAGINGWVELNIQPNCDKKAAAFTHRWEGLYPNEPEVCIDAKRLDDPTMQIARADAIKDAVKSGGATWNEWRTAMMLPRRPDCDKLVEQPDPNAAAAPGAAPGDPAMGAAPPADDDFDLGDLTPEPPTETSTGFKRPDLSRAGGRAFSTNGTGSH